MIVAENCPVEGFRPDRSRLKIVLFALLLVCAVISLVVGLSGWMLGAAGLLLLHWAVYVWQRYVVESHPRSIAVLYFRARHLILCHHDGRQQRARLADSSWVDGSVLMLDVMISPTSTSSGRRERFIWLPDQFTSGAWHNLVLHCTLRLHSNLSI